jgi:hypothetical protein
MLFRRLLVIAALATTAGALTAAPAMAQTPGPNVGGANACAAGSDSLSAGYCLAPSTFQLNYDTHQCPPFPDGRQWQNATDLNGVPELWTYPNGSTACIEVDYHPSQAYDNCDFYFYVPYGPTWKSSTSLVKFSYEDVQGTWHSATVDENPVSGWQLAFTSQIAIHLISFTDANGRGPTTSEEIAWGNQGTQFGIWQFCSTV